MAVHHKLLSGKRIEYLRAQGYCDQSDAELSELAFGNRFAYILCAFILAFAVITTSVWLLVLMTMVAFAGIILPYHPFDYIYNHYLREKLNKPELPPRPMQLKFACIIATIWLLVTIYMFNAGNVITGYILGGLLVIVASIVASTDFCIPSMIYNRYIKGLIEERD